MSLIFQRPRSYGVRFVFLKAFSIVIIVIGVVLLTGIFFFGRFPLLVFRIYAILLLIYIVIFSFFFCLSIYISLKAVLFRAHGNVNMVKVFFPGIISGFITLIVVSFCFLNYYQKYQRKGLLVCAQNLEKIGTELRVYSRNHRYPSSAKELKSALKAKIGHCPIAGKDEWDIGYDVDENSGRFTLYCNGKHHKSAQIPKNYPQYSSERGIILSSPENAPLSH